MRNRPFLFPSRAHGAQAVGLPTGVTLPGQRCPKGSAGGLAARATPSPSAAGAFGGGMGAAGLGLLKGWEVKGRRLRLLCCLQPSRLVSWTALRTAAGATQKEAIASRPLALGSPQNRHLAQHPGKAMGLLGCQHHLCHKRPEVGTARH